MEVTAVRHPALHSHTPVKTLKNGREHISFEYEAKNRDTDRYVNLRYSGYISDKAVFLDQQDALVSVNCDNADLVLDFGSDAAGASWAENLAVGAMISGGTKFQCLNANNDQSKMIFRKLTQAPRRTENGILLSTEPIAPWEFTAQMQFQFFSNDSVPAHSDVQEILRRRRALETRVDSCKGKCTATPFEATAINWNFDISTLKSKQEIVSVLDETNAKIYCADCYAYAGISVGLEYETVDYLGTKLLYLKVFVTGGLFFNFDGRMEFSGATTKKGVFFANPLDGNPAASTKDLAAANFEPDDSAKTMKEDVKLMVGPIPVLLNFKTPTYLQYDLSLDLTGNAGMSAYFKAGGQFGIAMTKCDSISITAKGCCSMPGCTEIADRATTSDTAAKWHQIYKTVFDYGAAGPTYDIKGQATAKLTISPVVQVLMWGGLVTVNLLLTPEATIKAVTPCPASGSPAESAHLTVTTKTGGILAWGAFKVTLDIGATSLTIFELSSSKMTLLAAPGQQLPATPIFDKCLNFADLVNIAAKATKAIEASKGGQLKLGAKAVGTKAVYDAFFDIPKNALTASKQLDLEVLTDKNAYFDAAQIAKYTVMGKPVSCTPDGTTFASDVKTVLSYTGDVPSGHSIRVIKASTKTAKDWTELGSADYTVDTAAKTVTFNIKSFSSYGVMSAEGSPPAGTSSSSSSGGGVLSGGSNNAPAFVGVAVAVLCVIFAFLG